MRDRRCRRRARRTGELDEAAFADVRRGGDEGRLTVERDLVSIQVVAGRQDDSGQIG